MSALNVLTSTSIGSTAHVLKSRPMNPKEADRILRPYHHVLMAVHDNPSLQFKLRKALLDAWMAGRLYQEIGKSDRAIPEQNTTDNV